MSDINKTWQSGVAISEPVFSKLSSKTPCTTFILLVKEEFYDRNQNKQFKVNEFVVESLGKAAKRTHEVVKKGNRYIVDGYLREDAGKVKIRTYAVYPDTSCEVIHYNQALKTILEILQKSRNIESAKQQVEELLKSL